MRSRRRNRGSAKLAWRTRDRTGELVILVNNSWAYNSGLVPGIRYCDYQSFDGFDQKNRHANVIDRKGDSIRMSFPNESSGVYLGYARVKMGRAGDKDEHWGLTGGYRILVEDNEFVVAPGYVHFVLDGPIRTV